MNLKICSWLKSYPSEIQLYYGCLENMGPWGCDFEDGANGGLCKGWSQEPIDDDFDWTIAQGMTMSSGTGPTDDHTFGSWHGHFAYIEVRGGVGYLQSHTEIGN